MKEILSSSTSALANIMYQNFKFAAFKMDAEKAHELGIHLAKNFPSSARGFNPRSYLLDSFNQNKYAIKVNGLIWPFPIGLPAGLDKNGEAIKFFSNLYFGAVEIGTVTLRSQEGNPKPRIFRYKGEESLRNCLGFNNLGSQKVLENLKAYRFFEKRASEKPIGVNIGKNKDTLPDMALYEYQKLYEMFYPYADYFVINVSSPNTPGLRDLQDPEYLKGLFSALDDSRKKLEKEKYPRRPLYLKIAPELGQREINAIIKVCVDGGGQGIIATNTLKMEERGVGGVSGKLIAEKSRKIRNYILSEIKGQEDFTVIGVGGISSFDDLLEFWKLGGKVVQIYTAFIYEGPHLLKKMVQEIDDYLLREETDFSSLFRSF